MIRALTSKEEKNFETLKTFTSNLAVVILTETGLNKSIMDATYSMRLFFKNNRIHDYRLQAQGPENKILIPVYYYKNNAFHELKISLYRPQTKDGDPRFWILGIKEFIDTDCALALVYAQNKLVVFNLSESSIEEMFEEGRVLKEFFSVTKEDEEKIAKELFDKILAIHKRGWIPAFGIGDKAVGATLEELLGIPANSSKNPDYKGIELKGSRKGKKGRVKSRSNLFAQVAEWHLSKLKSSAEMLRTLGYFRNGKNRLNCTLSTKTVNTQGLKLVLDQKAEVLYERHEKHGDCLVWSFDLLIKCLNEKHKETFWVEAESRMVDGKEEFRYTKIIHSKSPIVTQFIPLLEAGIITLDHLISSLPDYKQIRERGPLFKIHEKNLHLLFPELETYLLEDWDEAA